MTQDIYSVHAYDYTLPEGLIAAHPLPERDASRMMHLNAPTQSIAHMQFKSIVDSLSPGDLLVVNNTKVLPARFIGTRRDPEGELHSGKVEALLLHPQGQDDATVHRWHCLMKPARKLKVGTHIVLPNTEATLEVIEQGEAGHGVVQLHLGESSSPTLPLEGEGERARELDRFMQTHGHMPIPPYFNREATEDDKERYQTVYSEVQGSQAAPTAGLHFTNGILDQLKQKGVEFAEVTLSVGVGTFRPVMVDDVRDHDMHGEAYTLPQETVDAIKACKMRGNRVFAVGTTTTKTLETAAQNQGGTITQAESGWSNLYIYPGFEFAVVDAMLTNFHLPKSTLLMMISAFAGSREWVLQAYKEAVEQQYRFYSYGDCMLIER